MMQRYSLLAISLLTVSAVGAAAISIDPKGFAVKEWQPLIAALIALGGASIVYRGATLTYKAAMSKVDLDRFIHRETQKRQDLGVCLRLQYTLAKLDAEADLIAARIPPERIASRSRDIHPKDLHLAEPDGIVEAWENLAAFPIGISSSISDLRYWLSEAATYHQLLGEVPITVHSGLAVPHHLAGLRNVTEHVMKLCRDTNKALGAVVRGLHAS